ncbi:MAG: enoyl-CoA hydratase/isomerase family protein [Pseudomonadota bacterium]
MADQDVRFSIENGWGTITLARPKALNSLTSEMCVAMDTQLRTWADDPSVKAVLIKGEGERAFCAGGDIRWLATTAKESPTEAATFFRKEYKLNNLIAHYPKPYVALVHGVCMGGGVGVSAMADRRIMTRGTTWAMPECGIGLIPDVGATYVLSQMPGGLGLFLSLTGDRLKGRDCLEAGLATHVIEDDAYTDVYDALLRTPLDTDPLAAIDSALEPFAQRDPGRIAIIREDVDRLFGEASSVVLLQERLKAEGGAFGQKALEQMAPGSPTSMALTLRLLNEAPSTFSECIAREFCVTAHLMEGPDFLEGVRAQIIDKDRDPKWQPAQLDAVDEARIDWYFTEPEGGPLALE